MDKMAIILASGAGTRMMSDIPKPLHKICGMTMAEHTLRALDPIAPDKIMTVGYQKARIEQELHGQAEFVYQDKKDGWGTGHAVLSCLDKLRGRSGQVIITSCDKPLVLSETYARLMDETARTTACAMLTDITQTPFSYSRIIRKGGRIVKSARLGQLVGDELMIKEVDASVYCFDIEKLVGALGSLRRDDDGEYHISDIIEIMSNSGYTVTSVPALEKCECMGVNDRLQLAQAEKAMRERINNRHMRQGVTLIDPENTYIEPGVTINRDTVIYPGCTLDQGTVIGSGCVILSSHISASHIGANSRIEHSVLYDCEIPQSSKVGPGTVRKGVCDGAKA